MAYGMNIQKTVTPRLAYWPILSSLVLILYFAELFFPPITAITPSAYVCLGCAVLWFALSFINDPRYYLNIQPFVLLSIVFYVFTIIIPFVCGYSVISNRYASLAFVPLGYIVYDYHRVHGHMRYLKYVLSVTGVLALITAVTTYSALIENSYIVRSIKSGGEHTERLATQGIGGYHFVYAIVAASPIFLYIFLKTKDIKIKIITAAAYIFSLMLITKSNYLTAFLTVILASLIILCGYLLSKGGKAVLYIPPIIVSVFLSLLFYDQVSAFIQSHIPERIARVVFDSSNETLWESLAEEFLYDRYPAISNSISGFFENPVFGILGAGVLGVTGEYLTGFGQHSHILDTFALYGGLIGAVAVIVSLQPFRKNGRWVKGDTYFSIAVAVSMFSIYVLNNASETVAVVFNLLFPLIRDHYIEKTDRIF